MKEIKLLYTEDGRLLFSKFFPEAPPVMASIYADTLAMNKFNREMKEAVRLAIPVLNPDKAFEKIVFNERLERDKIYTITCDYETVYQESGYKIRITE